MHRQRQAGGEGRQDGEALGERHGASVGVASDNEAWQDGGVGKEPVRGK